VVERIFAEQALAARFIDGDQTRDHLLVGRAFANVIDSW
jgi:hypothetical protein